MHEVSTMCKTVGKQLDSRKSQTDKYLIQMRAAFTLSSVYYREYITLGGGDLTSSTLCSLSTMPFFFFTNVGKHLATRKRQDRQIVDTDSRSGYSFDPVNYKEYKTLMSIQPFCTFCRNHFLFTFNNNFFL